MQLKTKIKKIHKIVGLTAAIIIIYLSITGIILMYSNKLGLENKFINSNLVLSFYNLDTSKNVLVANQKTHKIFFISGSVYLNDDLILNNFFNPIGTLIINNNLLIISNKNKIFSYNFNDNVSFNDPNILFQSNNDEDITLLGLDDNGLIYFGINNNYYLLDHLTLKTSKKNINPKNINWSVIEKPKKNTAYDLLKTHQGPGISMLRIITEMHNGKIFGFLFSTIITISTLALIFLSFSGIYMGLKIKLRKKIFTKHN